MRRSLRSVRSCDARRRLPSYASASRLRCLCEWFLRDGWNLRPIWCDPRWTPFGFSFSKSKLCRWMSERRICWQWLRSHCQGAGEWCTRCNLLSEFHFPWRARRLSQPHFGQVWGWSPTLGKVGDLESTGTPECSEFDSKAQNTSHWGVLGVIGKVLKRRYRKWPRIGHSNICSPSYGQKKGRVLRSGLHQ